MCKNEKQEVQILDLKKRILADSLGLVVVVFVQNFESSEKCKLQGHIQQTSKKLQKQRACYYYYWFHISFLFSSTPAIPLKVTLVQSRLLKWATPHSWLTSSQKATSIATNYIKFSSFYGLSHGTTLKKKGVAVF